MLGFLEIANAIAMDHWLVDFISLVFYSNHSSEHAILGDRSYICHQEINRFNEAKFKGAYF